MVTLPIPFPLGYSLKVKPGDIVKTGDVLAQKETPTELAISIPKVLQIPIKHSAKALQKNPGDAVRRGTILAAKKRSFGLREDNIVSQIDGTFLRYERDTGTIVLLPQGQADSVLPEEKTIYSPIDGTVEVCDNGLSEDTSQHALQTGKILIQTDKDVILGKEGLGDEFTGSVLSIAQSQEDPEGRVQLHFLDSKVIGTIILGGVFDRDSLVKAIGMGVGGIIAFSIRDDDLAHIKERHLITPIVTVEKDAYMRLLSWNGKKAYIQGSQKTILLLHL
jgi:phosphotransferase system IIA component